MEQVRPKYDRVSRALHWLSAFVIIWAAFSGIYIASMSVNEHWRQVIGEFNVSLTTVFIPFFIWRVTNILCKKAPPYGSMLSDNQVLVAKIAHLFMYVLITIVLVTGVLMMPHEFSVFGVFKVPQLIHNEIALDKFKHVHFISSQMLAAAVLLHVLAVAKHEFNGNSVLRRMF